MWHNCGHLRRGVVAQLLDEAEGVCGTIVALRLGCGTLWP